LTKNEERFLKDEGFDPNEFLRLKKNADDYEFVEKRTGRKLVLRR
jgi:hypothetical protein